MKFSHKIVTASSALLLVTISLLSIKQIYTVQNTIENYVYSSINEVIGSVKNTIVAEMEARKNMAQSTTEILEIAPFDHSYIKKIIEQDKLKSSFITIGVMVLKKTAVSLKITIVGSLKSITIRVSALGMQTLKPPINWW
ncbi:hypothetical protein [Shewanella sp.]|uniref:hypothetical protein n=1 Tax=Shewanella sp. TaxID=50422 RepID=UPI003F3962A6